MGKQWLYIVLFRKPNMALMKLTMLSVMAQVLRLATEKNWHV